ncbi:MAG TPA: tRNA (guanosine(37)-N1)-methyltransferase TrmD [Candidatus Acidoferrales bacterium]|nr:tRNA (guanosine(37)-N1)-methyltransferase TrmD [Candidatus Acidoferrales bacterium]
MKISILTLFPEMFTGPFDHSIIKRAKEKGIVDIELINIRDFGIGPHKMVDDTPYGGGVGMVMRVDILHKAIEHAKNNFSKQWNNETMKQSVILMSASGKPYKQADAKLYSTLDHLIIICGHYEGVDERIMHYIDEEISIGDYVLTGGELPAMVIADSVTRLLAGAITEGAVEDESFSRPGQLLEYPHYTKPRGYENQDVPEVLLSGDHKKIAQWRDEKSLEKTKRVRPDLLKKIS